jgi:ATP-dependent DNA ligase
MMLCAFDLLELEGEDIRRVPIEERETALAKCCTGPRRILPTLQANRAP